MFRKEAGWSWGGAESAEHGAFFFVFGTRSEATVIGSAYLSHSWGCGGVGMGPELREGEVDLVNIAWMPLVLDESVRSR